MSEKQGIPSPIYLLSFLFPPFSFLLPFNITLLFHPASLTFLFLNKTHCPFISDHLFPLPLQLPQISQESFHFHAHIFSLRTTFLPSALCHIWRKLQYVFACSFQAVHTLSKCVTHIFSQLYIARNQKMIRLARSCIYYKLY